MLFVYPMQDRLQVISVIVQSAFCLCVCAPPDHLGARWGLPACLEAVPGRGKVGWNAECQAWMGRWTASHSPWMAP